jgi:type II secretory pathway pseudopilin PulG
MKPKKISNAFTLTELLLSVAILAFVLVSILLLFINCIVFNETNRNITFVYKAIESKMEEVKNASFDNLYTASNCPSPKPTGSFCHDDPPFNLEGFSSSNAKGRIEIISEADNLKKVSVIACFFKSKNRTIGEDADCDGVLDSGEDANNNSQLDQAAKIITLIAR